MTSEQGAPPDSAPSLAELRQRVALKPAEVGRLLGESEDWVRQHILPYCPAAVRVGRSHWLVLTDGLVQWLAAAEHTEIERGGTAPAETPLGKPRQRRWLTEPPRGTGVTTIASVAQRPKRSRVQ